MSRLSEIMRQDRTGVSQATTVPGFVTAVEILVLPQMDPNPVAFGVVWVMPC